MKLDQVDRFIGLNTKIGTTEEAAQKLKGKRLDHKGEPVDHNDGPECSAGLAQAWLSSCGGPARLFLRQLSGGSILCPMNDAMGLLPEAQDLLPYIGQMTAVLAEKGSYSAIDSEDRDDEGLPTGTAGST